MTTSTETSPVCAIVGVGPGNGAAFGRRFAAAGYRVALLSRSLGVSQELARALPGARAYACDVTRAASVEPSSPQRRSAWSFEVEARPFSEVW